MCFDGTNGLFFGTVVGGAAAGDAAVDGAAAGDAAVGGAAPNDICVALRAYVRGYPDYDVPLGYVPAPFEGRVLRCTTRSTGAYAVAACGTVVRVRRVVPVPSDFMM